VGASASGRKEWATCPVFIVGTERHIAVISRRGKMKTKPKIVVVGGSGFIGSCLVRKLVSWGYTVRILDKNRPDKHLDFVKVDLAREELPPTCFKGYNICICLAARSSGIGYFNEHPAEMLDENLKIISALFNTVARKDSPITRMIY